MENAKLTLKLSSSSIQRAKIYSAENSVSLSSIVEKFFDGLTLSGSGEKKEFKYSSIVNELSGVISIPEDYNYKTDYLEYLEKKYE